MLPLQTIKEKLNEVRNHYSTMPHSPVQKSIYDRRASISKNLLNNLKEKDSSIVFSLDRMIEKVEKDLSTKEKPYTISENYMLAEIRAILNTIRETKRQGNADLQYMLFVKYEKDSDDCYISSKLKR